MKKILFLLLFFLASFSLKAQQFGMGLSVEYSEYFGKSFFLTPPFKYPIGYPDKYPGMLGVRISGDFGKWKHRITGGFTYFLPLQTIDFNYYGIKWDMSRFNFDLNYKYYLFPFSSYESGGFYALAGGTVNFLTNNASIPDNTVSEAKLFESETIIGTNFNIGVGGEVEIPSGFLFVEAKAAIHTNAFINNTTIWQTPLVSFWQVGVGYRFFLGQPKKFVHPR